LGQLIGSDLGRGRVRKLIREVLESSYRMFSVAFLFKIQGGCEEVICMLLGDLCGREHMRILFFLWRSVAILGATGGEDDGGQKWE